ncbi:hypothetical protein HZC53_05210 [Candidatus Uhrbacteria bacterium]|nr:hypothetical protein [Candidatus Uhrbacteria bacterium]
MIPNKLIPAIAMLVLCGAGCFSKGPETAVNPSGAGTGTEKMTSIANVGVEAEPSGNASSTLVAIDDTWKTFHSNSGFSFRHPTKGASTPEWEIVRFKADDVTIKDGCVNLGSGAQSKSEFDEFCHTHSIIEMPDIYSLDYYTMKMGDGYLAIKFIKKLASIEGCSSYSVNRNSCVPFNEKDYKVVLDTSMSTFKFDK